MSKTILVTGGNAGIGFALCKQLVTEKGCRVFLGARSTAKGEAAVQDIAKSCGDPSLASNIEFVEIDVSSDESVKAAADAIKAKMEPKKLYAIVNNAGVGWNGTTSEQVLNTNFFGPKRVCEAFIPLICPKMGRIVSVGSGSGPMYVEKVKDREVQKMLCSPDVTLDWILDYAKTLGSDDDADTYHAYGFSKALLTCYTMVLAREHPHILSSCLSPGFIQTKMTEGMGASKSPEDATVPIMHCLFSTLDGNGWYYGSDAVRSPLHFLRNPGEPAYDGKNPFE